MRIGAISMALAGSLALAGCTSSGSFCRDNTLACVLLGKAVVATVVVIAHNNAPAPPSDARLKHDIDLLETLDNGIRLYAFSYLGDDQRFVGVMAQDLLADERYAGAVSVDENGFYHVDYRALGLEVDNLAGMLVAGARAIELAGS